MLLVQPCLVPLRHFYYILGVTQMLVLLFCMIKIIYFFVLFMVQYCVHLLKFINHWRKGNYTCSSTYGHPIISLPSNIPLELEFSQAICDCTYHSHVTILVCVTINVYVLLHDTVFQCNVSFFGEYIGH